MSNIKYYQTFLLLNYKTKVEVTFKVSKIVWTVILENYIVIFDNKSVPDASRQSTCSVGTQKTN